MVLSQELISWAEFLDARNLVKGFFKTLGVELDGGLVFKSEESWGS